MDGYRSILFQVERANIVESQDVIRVAVRVEHGVEPVHAGAQGLGAEVGRGINHHVAPAVGKKHGGARPVVARVRGLADGAMAAERRGTPMDVPRPERSVAVRT